ncbi:hypothetical protein [Malaciobacter marinus]|uniref:hypothetical protein n=1 Tax=Malaciobacter marinus TaxID=505249 RepID=UPI0009A8D12B|nr:hypothetical protein [Malaciobacter marinus]SKB79888.1 hypothetical protein SAMN06295997_1465 [Malaciobacter marinus]
MKLISLFLFTCIITSSIYAEMNDALKKMIERQNKEIEKIDKEWNDPYNKKIRELTKKHYGKTVNGDKEQQQLQKDIVDSIKEE